MSVITISRCSHSRGKEVAEKVAQGRDIIVKFNALNAGVLFLGVRLRQ